MKKIISFIVIAVFALTAIFVYRGLNRRNNIQTQTFVLEKVKDLKELNLVEYNYSGKIVDKRGNYTFDLFTQSFEIPSTWSEIVILYDMSVKASLDLESIKDGDIVVNGDEINIKLKSPYISCAEPSNIQVIESKGLFVGNKNYKDVANIYNEKMKTMSKESAIKNGIINKAKENAKKDIKDIVIKLRPNIKKVNFSFQD